MPKHGFCRSLNSAPAPSRSLRKRSRLSEAAGPVVPGRFVPTTQAMRTPSPAKKLAAGAIALALCASAWFFLAPPTVGGSTTYVFTDGTSMQPSFPTGDLVLVRPVPLAIAAYPRPATTLAPATVSYKQTGRFSYSAGAASGAAYPQGSLTTGDPVFLRLVHTVNVRLAYRFRSAAQHRVEGTASLDARIEASNGWKETIQLQAPRHFAGDSAALAGTLNVRSLPALLQRLETSTAVSGSYTLTIVPHVRLHGTLSGVPLRVPFAAEPLSFTLNTGELQAPPAGTKSPFSRSVAGTVPVARPKPASLSFKLFHVPV